MTNLDINNGDDAGLFGVTPGIGVDAVVFGNAAASGSARQASRHLFPQFP